MAKGQIGGTKKNINLKKEAERISPSLLSLQQEKPSLICSTEMHPFHAPLMAWHHRYIQPRGGSVV